MSAGNWGTVEHLVSGFLASEFTKDSNGVPVSTNPSDQGATQSIFMDAIRLVATRADLTEANIKVMAPKWFGTAEVLAYTGAAKLLGVVAMTNSTCAEDAAVLFYDTASAVTEGTDKFISAVFVGAGGTAATAKIASVVFTTPIPFATGITYSAVDNGSAGDIEGTSLADANGLLVMLVYAA